MHEKTRWQNLSVSSKAFIRVSAAIQICLLAAALWDIRRRAAADVRGQKRLWIVVSLYKQLAGLDLRLAADR